MGNDYTVSRRLQQWLVAIVWNTTINTWQLAPREEYGQLSKRSIIYNIFYAIEGNPATEHQAFVIILLSFCYYATKAVREKSENINTICISTKFLEESD